MDLLLPTCYLSIFLLIILRSSFFRLPSFSAKLSAGIFFLKVMAAASVWFLYTSYYPSPDYISFYNDSYQLARSLLSNHEAQLNTWDSSFDPLFFNSSRVMIILNMLLLPFSFGNIFVHFVFICFFSYCGLVALYKAFSRHFTSGLPLMAGVFLVPSLLFWGSAPLKEAVVLFFLGYFIYFSDFGFLKNQTRLQLVLAFLSLLALILTKPYVAAAVLPSTLVNVWVGRSSSSKLILKYLAVVSVMILFTSLISILFPSYNLLRILSDRQAKAIAEAKGGVFFVSDSNFIHIDYYTKEQKITSDTNDVYHLVPGTNYIAWPLENMRDTIFIDSATDTSAFRLLYTQKPARSVRYIRKTEPDIFSFLVASPASVFEVLLRPNLFEMKTWLHIPAALENMAIIGILLLCITFFRPPATDQWPIIGYAVLSSLIIFAIIGLTVPALGGMVRYRIIGLALFIPVLLQSTNWKKIGSYFKKR